MRYTLIMKIDKSLLGVFLLFGICTAPIRVDFSSLDDAKGSAELPLEAWQHGVDNPIEGRRQLIEIYSRLDPSKNPKCLEFLFGALQDPQPAKDGEIVPVTVFESRAVNLQFTLKVQQTLSARFIETAGESAIQIPVKTVRIFYFDGKIIELTCELSDELAKLLGHEGEDFKEMQCSKTYFKDLLNSCPQEDLPSGTEILFRPAQGSVFNTRAFCPLELLNFFEANNSEVVIAKITEAFANFDSDKRSYIPQYLGEFCFGKIFNKPLTSIVLGSQTLENRIHSMSRGAIEDGNPSRIANFCNTLVGISKPEHPLLTFPEGVDKEEFKKIFKAWYGIA